MDMTLHGSSKKHDWGTPTWWFNEMNEVFGFTVDACAQPHNTKLPRYWTPDQDGLKQDWFGERVWCNPPYGGALPEWSAKMKKENGFADLAMMLVPARTDTGWLHVFKHEELSFCFIKGRLKFEDTTDEQLPSVFSPTWFKFRFNYRKLVTFRPDDACPFPTVLIVSGAMNGAQKQYLRAIGLLMREF